MKIFFVFIGLLAAVFFLAFHEGWAQTRPEAKGPIIIHAFASSAGRYGDPLKIYLEADDPNGVMLRIATVVDHVGYGYYPTDWTYIKSQNQHHLIGYLQWNTFSSTGAQIHTGTIVTIHVSVFDKAGNESNEVVFPFTFETIPDPQPKPPAPFDQANIQRLGHIFVNLVNPGGERHIRIRPD